jgi:hypothetical protein
MDVILDAIAIGAVGAAAIYLFRRTVGGRAVVKGGAKGLGAGRGCGCQPTGCSRPLEEPGVIRTSNKIELKK